jgi:hypothetical protein
MRGWPAVSSAWSSPLRQPPGFGDVRRVAGHRDDDHRPSHLPEVVSDRHGASATRADAAMTDLLGREQVLHHFAQGCVGSRRLQRRLRISILTSRASLRSAAGSSACPRCAAGRYAAGVERVGWLVGERSHQFMIQTMRSSRLEGAGARHRGLTPGSTERIGWSSGRPQDSGRVTNRGTHAVGATHVNHNHGPDYHSDKALRAIAGELMRFSGLGSSSQSSSQGAAHDRRPRNQHGPANPAESQPGRSARNS